MDFQIPLAEDKWADCVSSERCAEASKPVMVYCVSRKPSGRTYSQYMLLPAKPELFTWLVNIHLRVWCSVGVKMRIAMIRAAPKTCHHTEILFNTACTLLLNTLNAVIRIMITMNQKNCCRI